MRAHVCDAGAGELVNLATASKYALKKADTCVVKYLRGDGELPEDMRELPEPFVLQEELPRLLAGLDPAAAAGAVESPGDVAWLPGLAAAHVGQPYMTNDFQVGPLRRPAQPVGLVTWL